MATTTAPGRWFPRQPPAYDGEDDGAYTDRLLGVGQPSPYNHPRNRQCSIGYHGECSERDMPMLDPWPALIAAVDAGGRSCACPCHTREGQAALRIDLLEETVAALCAQIRPARRLAAEAEALYAQIIAAHPEYAAWYPRQVPGE